VPAGDTALTTDTPPIQVLHLMRTYGAHGGEQQLSQYFASKPQGHVREAFAFLYRDPVCSALFAERAPDLEQIDLWRTPQQTTRAWGELGTLLPRLPTLQARVLSLVRRRRPDICMIHGFQAALAAWPAMLTLRRTRWGYVHRITKSKTGRHPLFRLVYRPFAVIAGNSRAVVQSLAPLTTPDRLVVLENGIDLDRFAHAVASEPRAPLPAATGPVIVAVGRLLPHKGQAIAITAFAGLSAAHPHAAMWILGDGPERAALERQAADAGVADRVHFLGHRSDVPAVLARASLFVNGSAWEGMSNAVLEAMAAGLPSVVADAPGVSECHLPGRTGFVVPRDAAAIGDALKRLLDDSALCAALGRAAQDHVRARYSMEANRRRYLTMYSHLTGRDACAAS